MIAKRVCAWCQTDMGTGETYNGQPTHGICDTCAAQLMQEMETLCEQHGQPDQATDVGGRHSLSRGNALR